MEQELENISLDEDAISDHEEGEHEIFEEESKEHGIAPS